jgi:hypothetical protein
MSQSSKIVRRITGLASVELSTSPWPKTSPRGSKAKGLSFERKVGKELKRQMASGELRQGDLHSGSWLKFLDRNGPGYAQPDHFVLYPDMILLLECKLKQNTQAEEQLQLLYRPLLERLFSRPVFCLQAFNHWRFKPNKMTLLGPNELLAYPREGVFTWHYMG